jgi:hypothetical protein
MPDCAFCGFGGDPERRWNREQQWKGAAPFTAQVLGREAADQAMTEPCPALLNDPQVFVPCTLNQVERRVPA